jgi:hypothetical protein
MQIAVRAGWLQGFVLAGLALGLAVPRHTIKLHRATTFDDFGSYMRELAVNEPFFVTVDGPSTRVLFGDPIIVEQDNVSIHIEVASPLPVYARAVVRATGEVLPFDGCVPAVGNPMHCILVTRSHVKAQPIDLELDSPSPVEVQVYTDGDVILTEPPPLAD